MYQFMPQLTQKIRPSSLLASLSTGKIVASPCNGSLNEALMSWKFKVLGIDSIISWSGPKIVRCDEWAPCIDKRPMCFNNNIMEFSILDGIGSPYIVIVRHSWVDGIVQSSLSSILEKELYTPPWFYTVTSAAKPCKSSKPFLHLNLTQLCP